MHVTLSQLNKRMRRLYVMGAEDEPEYDDEDFWRELLDTRGFGVVRDWRGQMWTKLPKPYRRTAAAIVHHSRRCSLGRCKQALTWRCASSRRCAC